MPYKYLLSKYPWYNYISLIKHEKYWNSWNLCAFPAMFEWPESDFSSTIQAIGRNFHSSSTSLSHTQWLYCSFFFCHKLRYTQLWQLKITRNSVPNAPSPWVSRRFATSQFLRLLVKRVAAYLSKSQCFNRLEWLIHLMKKQQTVDFGVFFGYVYRYRILNTHISVRRLARFCGWYMLITIPEMLFIQSRQGKKVPFARNFLIPSLQY